jgi:predicted DNA-binding transcriptional regulator AlpA
MNTIQMRSAPMPDCGAVLTADGALPLIPEGLRDRPALSLKELLRVIPVGRSKAYMLMKEDPTFPKGVPLYDGENSSKFYWTHEAIAWLQGRAAKIGANKGGL